ncbi:MAG: preprotein translocase subunit SecG [Verrucomicrobiota bacterium]
MSLFITLLTGVLVIDCIILTLLILMQLPKKEAGLGQAFGSGATDALFGAGSGNVLTHATTWAAGIFFALALLLTILGAHSNLNKKRTRDLEQGLANRPTKMVTPPAPAATPALQSTKSTNAIPLTVSTNK